MGVDGSDTFRDTHLQKAGAGDPLADVPTIYSYRRPARDWIAWLFDELMPLPADAVVLDVGCGPGPYVAAARARVPSGFVVPLDISLDRLRRIDGTGMVQSDILDLAIAEGSIDIALAMHVLYHLPDIPQGVAEIRRAVKPGGVLYALTNSHNDMPELAAVYRSCGLQRAEGMTGAAFTAENGARLVGTAFATVETVELHNSSLMVTDARAVAGEAARLGYSMARHLAPGVTWDGFLDDVRRTVADHIWHQGVFEITEHQALFVCS